MSKKLMPVASLVVFSLLLISFLQACSKASGGTTPGDDNPEPGVVDDAAGFYIRARKSDTHTYYQHVGDQTYGTDCSLTEASGQRIECFIEGEELDAYFNGLHIQYNVPSTMCSYLVFSPYYYFNRRAGSGPANVQEDTDKNGTIGVDTDSDGVVNIIGSVTCQFDYSLIGGPNCCIGSFSKITRSWDATAAPPAYTITSTTANNPWGGDISRCLAGPAMDSQTLSKSGFPRPDLIFVEGTGLNKVYDIEAPSKKEKGSNVYVANYFDKADHGGATPVQMVQPYYEFTCLDRAHEIKAQIRVLFREWNTETDFLARESSPANHSLTGFEPSPFGLEPINDYFDWKDFGATYPSE